MLILGMHNNVLIQAHDTNGIQQPQTVLTSRAEALLNTPIAAHTEQKAKNRYIARKLFSGALGALSVLCFFGSHTIYKDCIGPRCQQIVIGSFVLAILGTGCSTWAITNYSKARYLELRHRYDNLKEQQAKISDTVL